MAQRTETILIVDDEPSDIEFVTRALTRVGVTNPIRTAANGEEAIAYLTGQGAFANRIAHPFPRVVITDLKMPQMSGLQLLRWMQENAAFRVVPIIVFTSSTAQSDVNEAFRLGTSAYFVKPVEFKELERMVRIIADYWRLTLLPTYPL